jgi:hypothetical protein
MPIGAKPTEEPLCRLLLKATEAANPLAERPGLVLDVDRRSVITGVNWLRRGKERDSACWRLLLRLIKRDLIRAKVNALSLGSDRAPSTRKAPARKGEIQTASMLS